MRKFLSFTPYLMSLPAMANIDRAGNVIGSDDSHTSPLIFAIIGIGLLVYGIKNPSAPDCKLSLVIGAVMLGYSLMA